MRRRQLAFDLIRTPLGLSIRHLRFPGALPLDCRPRGAAEPDLAALDLSPPGVPFVRVREADVPDHLAPWPPEAIPF